MRISRQINARDLVLDEMMLCMKYLRRHVQMGCILLLRCLHSDRMNRHAVMNHWPLVFAR